MSLNGSSISKRRVWAAHNNLAQMLQQPVRGQSEFDLIFPYSRCIGQMTAGYGEAGELVNVRIDPFSSIVNERACLFGWSYELLMWSFQNMSRLSSEGNAPAFYYHIHGLFLARDRLGPPWHSLLTAPGHLAHTRTWLVPCAFSKTGN